MARAWLITRVSSEGQEEAQGPDAQLHAIRIQAERAGFAGEDFEVRKETVSGFDKLEERPELMAILDEAQAGDALF